jgi:MGT family glycosyltransferase
MQIFTSHSNAAASILGGVLVALTIWIVLFLKKNKKQAIAKAKANSPQKESGNAKNSLVISEIAYLSAIFPSHVYPMLGYFSELEARGLKVDVYGPPSVVKLFGESDGNCFEFPEIEPDEKEGSTGVLKAVCAGLLKTLPAIEAMWEEMDMKPKLIITDFSTTYALYLARKLKIPLLVYYPFYFPGDPKRLVYDSLEKGMMVKLRLPIIIQMFKVLKKYGVFFTSSEDMFIKGDQNISSMPKFIGEMIHDPSKGGYHYIGPGFRDATSPIDRVKFNYSLLKDDDIIFVSLGTHYLNSLSTVCYENIVEAFRDSTEKVIITASKEIIEFLGQKGLPSNILVMKWVPQLKVLGHSKLFITHAGTGGYLEGVGAGVPMLCLPNYCEQFINSDVAEKLNIGRWVRKEDRTAKKIYRISQEILADKSIKESCLKHKTQIHEISSESRKRFADILQSMMT